jgi:hypothetical protein
MDVLKALGFEVLKVTEIESLEGEAGTIVADSDWDG